MRKKGFTLVELIISLTIFAILLTGIIYALGIELSTWKRIANASEKQQIENLILARITRDIRCAAQIFPASNPDRLSLKIGSDTIEYSFTNAKVKRKKNNYSSYLSIEGDIQALSFSYPATNLVEVRLDDIKTQIYMRN
jgi:prepilin-type N-terminal cleavage/methylation domain-containing protein